MSDELNFGRIAFRAWRMCRAAGIAAESEATVDGDRPMSMLELY